MLPWNDYLYMKDYEMTRLPVVLAEAEKRRLLAEAGLIREPWIRCQICRSLWRLGRVLMNAGQRLERQYGPLTPSHA